MEQFAARTKAILDRMNSVIDGKPAETRTALLTLLAGGHLLVEDVPGVGKTMLARTLAGAVGGTINRIQFTPDLLPTDITGVSVYDQTRNQFEFKPGPVFANVVIGDEINRASAKTQSALLEAMAEGQVTADGTTYRLAEPFMVVATQNPVEMDGTFPLPEAQRDRFMARISMGYPDADAEVAMLRDHGAGSPLTGLGPVVDIEEARDLVRHVASLHVSTPVRRYVVALCQATRTHPHLRLGASPRAALQLQAAARAQAALAGRDHVLPDDVKDVAVAVLSHRLLLERRSGADSAQDIVRTILSDVRVPTEDAPPDPMKAAAPEARVDSRAKFTVRGWCFLAAAVLCLAAATWLGRKDVLALSLFLGMVPLLSSLAMWLVKPRVLLKRSVDPPLVTLGDAAQVALRVRRRSAFSARNRTSGAARAGSTHDPVDPAVHDMGTAGGGLTGGMGDGPADAANPGRGAGPDTTDADRRGTLRSGRTSAVAAVDVHETVDPLLGRDQDVSVPVSGAPVTYTVRPRRRGIHELGPATVRVGDPFGVVTELLDVAERTSLYVAPEPEDLTEHGVTMARESGNDPSRRAQPQPGPDNVMTREYRHGDPMRRVHWAASAKHGQLMVRQEDPRSTRSAVVVLDSAAEHWPGARVWAGVLESTEEFEWAVRAAASVIEHLTRRETVVHALDDQGRAMPRGEAPVADLRDTDVTDDTATEVVHGLSRAALVSRPESEASTDPLTERLEREGLSHPLLLLTGRLSPAAARRYVTAAAASTVCSVIMVIDAPAHRPDSAAVFESAGWSVVLVTRWTDVDAAWLATTRGATLLTPPPPDPGTRQLRMDEMMGHARGRATA